MVDLTFLRTFTKGNEAKFNRYINLYLEDTPVTFERMLKNIKEENWPDLAINAHSLKPKTDFMGIPELKEILVQIESDVNNQDFGNLKDLYERAFQIHQEAEVFLKEQIRST